MMGIRFKSFFATDGDFFDSTLEDAKAFFKEEYGAELRIVANEDSRLMRALSWFHRLIGNRDWLNTTCMAWWVTAWVVMGRPTIYMPRQYIGTASAAMTVIHECAHFEQMAKMSTFGFLFAYLLLWFPIGFSMRVKLELEAVRAEMLAVVCYQGVGRASQYAKRVLDSLTGSKYVWPTFNKDRVAAELTEMVSNAAKIDAEVEAQIFAAQWDARAVSEKFWQDSGRDMTPQGSA